MGTDIHMWVERLSDKDEVNCVAQLNFGRDYVLFGKMAGVRYAEDSTIQPRGIPDKISMEYSWELKCWYPGDMHSHSWLAIDDLVKIYKSYSRAWDRPYELKMWISMMKGIEKSTGDKTRIVFFFDN